ncbi:MAG: SocA family protein [Chloroflexi bacterium]|nr:SocA family protein [Chloroflexota bacterium]
MRRTKPFRFPYDEEKLREAIIYVALSSKADALFGAVKLNKILYYADFAAYRRLGQPITGASYQKLAEGPAPKQMLPIRRMMVDAGDIRIEVRPYFSGVQHRLVVEPHIAKDFAPRRLSPKEIEILDEVIQAMWHMTAREVSDYSHREPGWLVTNVGDTIPYETAWLSGDTPSQEAEEYGRRLVGLPI